jgi:hypothetical protein
MQSVRPAGRGFFPLDEELELLPGKLTPREHERLVRLSGWVSFERAVELLADFLGIESARSWHKTTRKQRGRYTYKYRKQK